MTDEPHPIRARPARVLVMELERRRGRQSGLDYLIGVIGGVKVYVAPVFDFVADPQRPEVLGLANVYVEELAPRSRQRVPEQVPVASLTEPPPDEQHAAAQARAAAQSSPPASPPPRPARRMGAKARQEAAARDVLERLGVGDGPLDDGAPIGDLAP